MSQNKAAIWIVSGEDYLKEADLSAWSVSQHMPSLERALFTPDEGVKPGNFTTVQHLPSRLHRITWVDWGLDCMRYLDEILPDLPEFLVWLTADTYCCAPFDMMFDILTKFDIASRATPGNVTGPTVYPIPSFFPEMSICVLGLHNTPKLRSFIHNWYCNSRDNWDTYHGDQQSLREALWLYDDIRPFYTPDEWVAFMAVPNIVCRQTMFLHGRLGTQKIYEDPERMANYARDITAGKGFRVWKA